MKHGGRVAVVTGGSSGIGQAIASALAAGGYWFWMGRAKTDGPLVLQGNVEVRQVNIGFKVAGRLKSLDVDEGASVKQGQKLASLDKIYFEDTLRQLRTQADQAAAHLESFDARADLLRGLAGFVVGRDA